MGNNPILKIISPRPIISQIDPFLNKHINQIKRNYNQKPMVKIIGYTLLELLITLTLGAILLSGATASWKTFIAKNSITANVNKILAAIQLARSEAITRNESITFCQSANHQTCSGEWNDGQIIIDQHSKIIRVFPAIPKTDNLNWHNSFGKNDAITFTAAGTTNGEQGSFHYYAKKSPENVYLIIVEHTGRVRVEAKEQNKSWKNS